MSNAIQNRYEFILLFDVANGNPNGDPDAGNMPRIDPETNHGLVTDVCLKRKIRNYIDIAKGNQSPYRIYIREKACLTNVREDAYKNDISEKSEKITNGRKWMCDNFFDVRTFGAVMSVKENNCGQVRGPVQIAFSKSVDPVLPLELTITRMAVETPKEAESQDGDNRTMGNKNLIPYGLYRTHGFISAHFAEDTGFSEDDLEIFWSALINMFDHDHSASRGEVRARKLVVFKHQNKLGNMPSHKLFDSLTVTKKADLNTPARDYSDYVVKLDESSIKDVEVLNLL